MTKTGATSEVEATTAANGDDPTKHVRSGTAADAKKEQKENGLMALENQKKDGTEVRKDDDTKTEDVKCGTNGDRNKGVQEENEREADIMPEPEVAKVEEKRENEKQAGRAQEVNDMDGEDTKASGEKIEIVGNLEDANMQNESDAKKEHSKEVEEWKKVEDGKGNKSKGDIEKERGGTEVGNINQEKDANGERKEYEHQVAKGVEHKEEVAGEVKDAKEIEHTGEEEDAKKKIKEIRHNKSEINERKDVEEKKEENDIGVEKKIEEEVEEVKEIEKDVEKQGKETGDTGKEEKATVKEFDKEEKEVKEEINKEEIGVEKEIKEKEGEEGVEKEEKESEDTEKEEKTTEKEFEEEEKEASEEIKEKEQETKEEIDEEEKDVEKGTEKEGKEVDDEIEKEEEEEIGKEEEEEIGKEDEEIEGEIEKEEDKTEKYGRKRKWYGEKGEVDENKERKKAKEVLSSPLHFSIDRPQRERKTVERLVEVIEKGSEKSFRIEKGQGTPLKDIPNVAYKLSKRKPDDIKLLHNLLFGRKGKAIDFKNHISQFSGFVWHGNEDKEREKVREKLDRYVKEKLLDFCDVFDILVSKAAARKEDLVNKLLDFMITPHATSDVLLAEKEQDSSRKRKRGPRGSASRSGGSFGKRPRKRLARGEDTPKSAQKNISETESDDDDEPKEDTENDKHDEPEDEKHSDSEKNNESVKHEGSDDERDEVTEKSIDEKMSSKRKSSSGRVKSKKVTTPTKSTSSSAKSMKASSSSSKHTKDEKKINDSNEKVFSRKKKVNEVPKKSIPKSASNMENSGSKEGRGKAKTMKAKDSGPSKEELRERICEILDEVDFSTATFTDILKLLAGHFKTDLTARKTSIKLMIQEELRKLADADDDNEDDEDEGDAGKGEKQPRSREMEA